MWLSSWFSGTRDRRVTAWHGQGADYEVPRGHVGTDIPVWRHLVSGALSDVHDGRLVALVSARSSAPVVGSVWTLTTLDGG